MLSNPAVLFVVSCFSCFATDSILIGLNWKVWFVGELSIGLSLLESALHNLEPIVEKYLLKRFAINVEDGVD